MAEVGPVLVEQVEVEAKMQIVSAAELAALSSLEEIHSLSASEARTVIDLYLDTPDGQLRSQDRLLRLRRSTGASDTTTELSWKGPRLDAQIDTRDDVSLLFSTDCIADLERFLARLGYIPYLRITKQRRESRAGMFEYELDENLQLLDMQTGVEKPLGDFLSVCASIPLAHSSEMLRDSRAAVLAKTAEFSRAARLESRTFVDIYQQPAGSGDAG